MTQEERQAKYSETLHFALDEYTEIEKEVKRLGKRIAALRKTIQGLSELTGETLFFEDFGAGKGTIVVTNETRLRARINSGIKK